MIRTISEFPLILLCGGKSSRMGTPKGLLLIEGTPWYQHHIDRFRQFGGSHIILVLGHHVQIYLDHLSWIPGKNGQWVSHDGLNISVAINLRPNLGQFSSLQCGIERVIQGGFAGAFILPVDMPNPKNAVWESLHENMTDSIDACIPSMKGRAGHPVLLSLKFMESLSKKTPYQPESRLDLQIQRLSKDKICYVDVDDPKIIMNVNTTADYNLM